MGLVGLVAPLVREQDPQVDLAARRAAGLCSFQEEAEVEGRVRAREVRRE